MPSSDPLVGHDAILLYAGGLSRPEITTACLDFLGARSPPCVYAWGLAPEALTELEHHLPFGSHLIEIVPARHILGAPDTASCQQQSSPTPRVVVFGAAVARDVRALLEGLPPAGGGSCDGLFPGTGPCDVGGPRYALVPPDLDLRREAVLFDLMALDDLTGVLRSECPWDRRQTQRDIVSYTLEETYELVDAVRADPPRPEDIEGELGDLLFQVYFLAKVAEEEGAYDLGSVARGIHAKLVRRHPHIFGEVEAATAEAVKRNWDEIKRTTEGRVGIFHEVPDSLPATLFAQKLQQRAAAVGFDWDDIIGPVGKVREEMGELTEVLDSMGPASHRPSARLTGEIGDVMFAVVNLARKLKVDPELALREAAGRFRSRVEGAVVLAAGEGSDFSSLDLDSQEAYYQQAKAELENA